jgi:HEAT repeat protein
LARDNEWEIIIDNLIKNPPQLLALTAHSIFFPDHDARWQIAYGLGEINENDNEIKNLLNMFLQDEKEYVRRRASFAFEKKGFKL